MTREEMIKELKTVYLGDSIKMREAKNMAIKALEQEPCEDCISREATVKRLCQIAEIINKERDGLGSPYVMAALFIQDNKDEFPPVTPQPKMGHCDWIPVSERLPEEYKEVIVTDIETSDTYLSRYIGNGYWECDNGLFNIKNRIIAWQPKPKPYKSEIQTCEESEDKE